MKHLCPSGYFPYHYPGLSRSAHWVMGFLAAVFNPLEIETDLAE
jgi:hypothetical protein